MLTRRMLRDQALRWYFPEWSVATRRAVADQLDRDFPPGPWHVAERTDRWIDGPAVAQVARDYEVTRPVARAMLWGNL